eukprot:scaffold18737_cov56-Attheya_sp.AAC.1
MIFPLSGVNIKSRQNKKLGLPDLHPTGTWVSYLLIPTLGSMIGARWQLQCRRLRCHRRL